MILTPLPTMCARLPVCRSIQKQILPPARLSSPPIAPSVTAKPGKGKRELGAPDLTDAIWLYGPGRDVIIDGLWNGRGGVMPAWIDRLDESTIKALAVYVHTLGGGEK